MAKSAIAKAVADVAGTSEQMGEAGHVLASQFIKDAENVGKILDSQRVGRKEKLAMLVKLSEKAVVVFTLDMVARMDKVNADREAANKAPGMEGAYPNMREWFDGFPGQGSIYAETSMWVKLGRAVDSGWRPDLTMPWDKISQSATAHMNARASAEAAANHAQNPGAAATETPAANKGKGSGKNDGSSGRGRTPKAPEVKGAEQAIKALTGPDNKPLPKNNRNLAKMIEHILDAGGGATLEELREVGAIVLKRIEAAEQAAKVMADAKDKANKGEKPKTPVLVQADGTIVKRSGNGATVTVRPAAVVPTQKAEGPSPADKLVETGKEIVHADAAAKTARRAKNPA